MIKIIAIFAVIMTCSATYLPVGPAAVVVEKPIPYTFGYDTTDEYGTTLTRNEAGDGSGVVKGSYSYKDGQGIIRVVDYIADAAGFRASVKTNEPGTETSAPAAVQINSNPIKIAAVAPLGPRILAPRRLAPVIAAAPVLGLAPKNLWGAQKWI